MNKEKTKIGVVGLGYVGSPIKKWFEREGYKVFVYDKFKKIGSVEEINKADVIFVAVPTPFHEDGRGYDDSAVRESLQNIKDGKVVVIKSTVTPGSTKKFQETYPKKIILFNPEFLRAKTSEEDYLHPNIQVVGYASEKGKEIAPKILELLPRADFSEIITSTEAEVLKYWVSSYLATRVVFANEIYDLCEALGDADYNAVKNCLVQDPRIGNSHWDVHDDGYRGFGGACFPKDVQAILQKAQELGVELTLIKQGHETNKRLTKNEK
ncbi:MAG: NAD(P)-binding domain-containing protein [Nanoarchaeota archaeon]|nr:NAD(P)-binding domain-containing protein [Nanoarchaeota archaeon]